MRIDAHVHLWQLARGDYGWLTPDSGPLFRDYDLSDLESLLVANGIDGAILVQAAPTEAETEFLLALAQRSERIRGVVGWVDLDATDVAARIAKLADHPKAVGIRPMLQDIAERHWVLSPTRAAGLEACAAAGLVFDALVRPDQLEDIAVLAGREPLLTIVIDHAAKPPIAQDGFAQWAAAIERAAALPNIACKLSGLLTEAPRGADEDTLAPYVAHLFACFRPDRIIWGSDWPVLTLCADYPRWNDLSERLIGHLGSAARGDILGGNAARVYRLDDRLTPAAPSAIQLHPEDNVVVCCRAIEAGRRISVAGYDLIAGEAVELGHKLAVRALDAGEKVIKYGAPIGSMTAAVPAGGWVHMHNMKSDYISVHTRTASGGGVA